MIGVIGKGSAGQLTVQRGGGRHGMVSVYYQVLRELQRRGTVGEEGRKPMIEQGMKNRELRCERDGTETK